VDVLISEQEKDHGQETESSGWYPQGAGMSHRGTSGDGGKGAARVSAPLFFPKGKEAQE